MCNGYTNGVKIEWIDYDVQQPKGGEIVAFWEKYSSEPFMGRLLKHGIYVYTE